MENENKRTGKGFVILFIGLTIGALVYIGYLMHQAVQDHREFKHQLEIDNQVDIQRLDDSTYHINLGNGSACFTIEKFQDSLCFSSVNVVMAILNRDTLTVMSRASCATWNHIYQFAYHDFFEDTLPCRSKINFNLN